MAVRLIYWESELDFRSLVIADALAQRILYRTSNGWVHDIQMQAVCYTLYMHMMQ